MLTLPGPGNVGNMIAWRSTLHARLSEDRLFNSSRFHAHSEVSRDSWSGYQDERHAFLSTVEMRFIAAPAALPLNDAAVIPSDQ